MKKILLFGTVLLAAVWMINRPGDNTGSEDLLMDNVEALAFGSNGGGGEGGPTDPWGQPIPYPCYSIFLNRAYQHSFKNCNASAGPQRAAPGDCGEEEYRYPDVNSMGQCYKGGSSSGPS